MGKTALINEFTKDKATIFLRVLKPTPSKISITFQDALWSTISYMEDHILAYKAPLYGRRTAQLKVNPFDFFESCRCFAGRPGVDKALAYGIVGGTPQYLTGCSRMNEISNKAGEDTSICAAYMKNLTALDIAQFFAKDMDPLDLTPEQKEIQDKIYLVYNPASQK